MAIDLEHIHLDFFEGEDFVRELFQGYYPPSDEEFYEIWDSGLVILDANALLNLFKYSEATRNVFFEILERLKTKLWIPHQVGYEFHENRLKVTYSQRKAYDTFDGRIEKAISEPINILDEYKDHSSIDVSALLAIFEEVNERARKELTKLKSEQPGDSKIAQKEADILNKITALYSGKIGGAFTETELESLYVEGAKRYEAKIPPGHEDVKTKQHPKMYGDLILWKQILEKVKSNPTSAIFVTDDAKEDWWWVFEGKTIGPRHQLVDEYAETTSGKRIHFYSVKQFLNYGTEKLTIKVSKSTLDEVQSFATSGLAHGFFNTTQTYLENLRMRGTSSFEEITSYFSVEDEVKWNEFWQNIVDLEYAKPQKTEPSFLDVTGRIKSEEVLKYEQIIEDLHWKKSMNNWYSEKIMWFRQLRIILLIELRQLKGERKDAIYSSDLMKQGDLESEILRIDKEIENNMNQRLHFEV